MSQAIEIKLVSHPPQTARSSETPAVTYNPPEISPTAGGNENGAIFFELDWLNQQADTRRQQITESLHNNPFFTSGDETENLPTTLIETARNIESEKLIETARDKSVELPKEHENFERTRHQTETNQREARQNVEQHSAKNKNLPADQNSSDPNVNGVPIKHAEESHTQKHLQNQMRGEQATLPARNQTSEPQIVRETVNQNGSPIHNTASNAIHAQRSPANSRAAEIAPTDILEENPSAANKTLSAKTVPLNLEEPQAKGEFAARETNISQPKTINGNPIFNESSATRIYNQPNSENASNNSALRHESSAAIGGALINGAPAAVEDFTPPGNIQIAGSGSGNFYDSTESIFAAGATGALMSATVGSVVPSASGAVSGMLGFVSGIVVGTEVEQALRWLSSDKADAANNPLESKIDETVGESSGLQLGYA